MHVDGVWRTGVAPRVNLRGAAREIQKGSVCMHANGFLSDISRFHSHPELWWRRFRASVSKGKCICTLMDFRSDDLCSNISRITSHRELWRGRSPRE